MNYLRKTLAAIGVFLLMGAAGTSDYNTAAGLPDPLWKLFLMTGIGFLLMAPAFINYIRKENENNDYL